MRRWRALAWRLRLDRRLSLCNPKRQPSWLQRWLTEGLISLGFVHEDYAAIHSRPDRLLIGLRVSLGTRTILNTEGGSIRIGNDTIFGHGVMLLTGTHRFVDGKRAKLVGLKHLEVPTTQRDIVIGAGCFLGSGAILLGPLRVGDHCLIAAGAVVQKDVPDGYMAVGNPARVLPYLAGQRSADAL